MNTHRSAPSPPPRSGLILGFGAYVLWGVLPLYFKALAPVAPFDIVAHRVLWSLPFLALLILLARGWPKMREAFADKRTLALLAVSATLIAANWLLYVGAVMGGHILAASFGYYLNPLANVLLGRFVLHERLSRLQWLAVAMAAAGISVLAAGALGQLWISLSLCTTFALYGLLRKVVRVDAVTGLAIETAILFPLALLWLGARSAAGVPVMGTATTQSLLLVLAGIASTTPLLLFTAAARKLPYSTLGMLQFIAPTLQFLIAVLLFSEPFTRAHAIAFGAIWTAVLMFVVALTRASRTRSEPLLAPPE